MILPMTPIFVNQIRKNRLEPYRLQAVYWCYTWLVSSSITHKKNNP